MKWSNDTPEQQRIKEPFAHPATLNFIY